MALANEYVKVAYSTFSRKFTKNQEIDGKYLCNQGKITAVKNEYECGQIILTALKDVNYEIEVSDFADKFGNVIDSKQIEIFVEKFYKLWRCGDYKGNFPDYYPDALMPYLQVVKNKDNTIKKGDNAIIVLQVHTLKKQVSGEYFGSVKILLPKPLEFPVCINVLDVVIPDGSGLNTLFHFDGSKIAHFENGKCPKSTYDKYVDCAIAHRIGVTAVLPKFDWSDEGIKNSVNEMFEYIEKGGAFTSVPTYPRTYIRGRQIFDRDILIKYIVEISNKCLETGINMFDKIGFYDWCIDEPFCLKRVDDGIYDGLIHNELDAFKDCLLKVVKIIEQDPKFNSEFAQTIISSVKNFRHIVTDYYDYKVHEPNYVQKDKHGQDLKYNLNEVLLCPKFDGFDTPEHRKPYENTETWWYNCGDPNGPFVTYQIDESLSAPKVLTWMMSDFGITGNLYWNCNYIIEETEDFTIKTLVDPYGLRGGNGAGQLVYPGYPYGVDGPISSMRLDAIRDGQEDYEILTLLKDEYKNKGQDIDGIYSLIVSLLYDNSKLDYFGDYYDIARENVLNLLLLSTKHGVTVSVDKTEKISFSIIGEANEVFVDGKKVANSFALNKESKWINLTIVVDGKEFSLNLYLGEGLKIVLNHQLSQSVISGDVKEIGCENWECIYHTKINLIDKNKKIVFKFDEDFSTVKNFSLCFLAKYSSRYEVYSGGAKISEGEFIALEEKYGTANRLNLNGNTIVDNTFELKLLDTDFIGLRETYFYK